MAIDLVIDPLDSPGSLADWQRLYNLTDVLALSFKNPWPVDDATHMIKRGSVFYIGGAWYRANIDVAITGTPSDYIQMTVDTINNLITPAYVSTLTDVTWNDQWNGWYDTTGHFYVFDENVAYGAGLIDFPRTVSYSRPKNAESAKALSTAMGDNWAHFLECSVNPFDVDIVHFGLPNTKFPTYNSSKTDTSPGGIYDTGDWVSICTFHITGSRVPATLRAFRFVYTNDRDISVHDVRLVVNGSQVAAWSDVAYYSADLTGLSIDITNPVLVEVQYKGDTSTFITGPFSSTVSGSCMSDSDPSPNLFQFLLNINGGGVTY